MNQPDQPASDPSSPPPAFADLLALYDAEMRAGPAEPGFLREETPAVVRYINQIGPGAWVQHARLTPENLAPVIDEQIAYFTGLGRDFEWKVFTHDWPPDLHRRLEARGFAVGEEEALMALDLDDAPARLFEVPRWNVRRLSGAELGLVAQLQNAVWEADYTWLADELAATLQTHPDELEVYAITPGDRAACAAWARFHAGTHFASLWGGSTLPEYRGQGMYHDLVGVRARSAREKGYRYLTVDASPMSRPILERLGFVRISTTVPCTWKVRQA